MNKYIISPTGFIVGVGSKWQQVCEGIIKHEELTVEDIICTGRTIREQIKEREIKTMIFYHSVMFKELPDERFSLPYFNGDNLRPVGNPQLSFVNYLNWLCREYPDDTDLGRNVRNYIKMILTFV